MNPSIIGTIVFACTFAGALLGMWLRKVLPAHQLDDDSKDTVKAGVGLIATMTALVLGLITASAKSTFDSVNATVKHTATQVLALDRVLARYGSDTEKIRTGLQETFVARVDMIWPQGSTDAPVLDPMRSGAGLQLERLAYAIQSLKPADDSQRALQSRALNIAEELLQERWLAVSATGTSIPVPFLTILLFWLTIIFTSFGLFAPRNTLVVTVLFVCALSVGSAVFLVLEMDGPFDGLLKVSSEPLRYARAHLNQ